MNLSDKCFLFLEKNNFDKIRIVEYDQQQLILRNIKEKYKNFKFPNLNILIAPKIYFVKLSILH